MRPSGAQWLTVVFRLAGVLHWRHLQPQGGSPLDARWRRWEARAASQRQKWAASVRGWTSRSILLGRLTDHTHSLYVYLAPMDVHGRLRRHLQVLSRMVVVVFGINVLGYREVLGIALGDNKAEGFWRSVPGLLMERGDWHPAGGQSVTGVAGGMEVGTPPLLL